MTRFNNESSSSSSSSSETCPASTSSSLVLEKPEVNLIGQPCGHHGSYTFYKAFSYRRMPCQPERVLMLGEFFFVRISPHDDPCIGELQLLWEDHQRHQLLSSTRLYFLPEQTPDGRLSHHGQHEVMAAQDKVILKLTDLVTWITHKVDWIAGMPYVWKPPTNGLPSIPQSSIEISTTKTDDNSNKTRQMLSSLAFIHNQNVIPRKDSGPFLTSQRHISTSCKIRFSSNNSNNLNNKKSESLSPNSSSLISSSTTLYHSYFRSFASSRVDFSDIIPQKLKANELQDDLSTVVVLSYNRYCRYRNLLKRIEGKEDEMLSKWIVQNVLTELGIPQQRNERVNILFCRDTFNHEALLNNDLNCDHLAPKFKGRPKKRPLKHKTSTARASSPESISSSEENARLFSPRRTRRTTAASTLASNRLTNQTLSSSSSSSSFDNHRKNAKKTAKSSSKTKNLKRSNSNIGDVDGDVFGLKNSKNNNKKVDKENNKPGNININGRSNNNGIHTKEDGGSDKNMNNVDANNNINKYKDTTGININWKNNRQINNKETFLKELNEFMNERKTPIHRVPNLGFKKIDLYLFFTQAQKYGGYERITKQRLWKRLYDAMGGDKRSTSAATCTRRHYEKLLLPFERLLNGLPDDLPIKKYKINSKNTDRISNNNNTSNENESDLDGIGDESSSNFSESNDSKDNDDSDVRVSKSKNEDNLIAVNENPSNKSNDDDDDGDNDDDDDDDDSMIDANHEVILKRSQTMISQAISKEKRIQLTEPEPYDCEVLIKERQNTSNTNPIIDPSTENDMKVIEKDDLVSKETGKLFRDISTKQTDLHNDENIQLNNVAIDNGSNEILSNVNNNNHHHSKLLPTNDDEGPQYNHQPSKKVKLDIDNDKCSINVMPSTNDVTNVRPSINPTSLVKNERINPSTVLFSNLNSHTKMTALVHPTQRKLKNDDSHNGDDVYDFRDFNSGENDHEILLLKSFKDKNQKDVDKMKSLKNPSPLHSISNLISNMSETNDKINKNHEELGGDEILNKLEKDCSKNNLTPKDFLQNVFSLPKPFENPKKVLMPFKGNIQSVKEKSNIEPMPAHRNSNPFENNSKEKFIPQIDEILDLSVKKRCHEADSRTSPTNHAFEDSMNNSSLASSDGILLDLTTKNKLLNVSHKPMHKTEFLENSIQRKSSHNYVKNTKNRDSRNSIINQIAYAVTDMNKRGHNHFNHKMNRQEKTKQSNKSSIHSTVSNSLKPSISEYNPQLPQFIGSHCHYWSNWPTVPFSSMFSYSNPVPSSTNTTTTSINNIPIVLPQFISSSLGSPSFSSNDTSSITNPLLGSVNSTAAAMLDRAKLLEVCSSASPFKNLLEQNPFLSGGDISNLEINYNFNNLFTSSSKFK